MKLVACAGVNWIWKIGYGGYPENESDSRYRTARPSRMKAGGFPTRRELIRQGGYANGQDAS